MQKESEQVRGTHSLWWAMLRTAQGMGKMGANKGEFGTGQDIKEK